MSTKQTIAKSLSKSNKILFRFANHQDKFSSVVDEIITGNPSADVEAIACPVNHEI